MNYQPILYILGALLTILSFCMVIPMMTDMYLGHTDWHIFFLCILLNSFVGGSLMLSNAAPDFNINSRQAFVLTTLSWLTIAIFGALPFTLSAIDLSYADAFFEAMSGITTTGATIMTQINEAPPGILMWRAILQWLGGVGIIIMAIAVLPILKIGGMQLFKLESAQSEKARPRVAQLSLSILWVYCILTALCMIGYRISGLSPFDAIAYGLTTISSGGFATTNEGFSGMNNLGAEFIAFIFMIISGLPFILFLKAGHNNWSVFRRDTQVKAYIITLGLAALFLVVCFVAIDHIHVGAALRRALFNTVSIMTGTGFTNADTAHLSNYGIGILFFLMVIGGCAGSTTSGLKIFRFQILQSIAKSQIKKLIYPSGMFMARYNKQNLSKEAVMSVLSFFFLFAISFSIATMILSYIGLDLITALSAAVSCLANVGPGFGEVIGPSGTYAPLPDSAKWLLSFCMLLGRLEFFTILVLLSPLFWQK